MDNKSSQSRSQVSKENNGKGKSGSSDSTSTSYLTPQSYDGPEFCESCWKMVNLVPLSYTQKTPWTRLINPNFAGNYDCQLCLSLAKIINDVRKRNLTLIKYFEAPENNRDDPVWMQIVRKVAEEDPALGWTPWITLHVMLESTSAQERIQSKAGIKPTYGSRDWWNLNTVTFEWEDKYSVSDGNSQVFNESCGPFRFRAEPGQLSATWVTNRKLSADFGSETNFCQVKDWIDNCQAKHVHCSKLKGPLPTRVLRVGNIRDPCIRLYKTDREAKNYMALSYCWGGPQEVKLTEDNVEELMHQIEVANLPQTIQDAVTVTRKLGEEYLWIDSLCIIQDSAKDKMQEIGRMDEVYKNAYLTISAANGKTCYDGFLGTRNMPKEIPWPYECPTNIRSIGFIQDVSHLIEHEPIDLRAWTMQESMLAQRLLCYGTEQISWICPNRLESFDSPVPPLPHGVASLFITDKLMMTKEYQNAMQEAKDMMTKEYKKAMQEEKSMVGSFEGGDEAGALDWTLIIEDYSNRSLTNQTDKLLAISSLAKEWSILHGEEDGQYVAGLFLKKFPRHLMWFIQKEAQRPSVPPYVAPTWSWASVTGSVNYNIYLQHDGKPTSPPSANFFEVLECSTTPISEDVPMGSLSSAVLKIRGCIRQVHEFVGREMDEAVVMLMDEEKDHNIGMRAWWLRVYTDREYDELHRTEGLVLKHLHGNMYSRIGVFYEIDKMLKRTHAFGEDFRGSFMTGVFKDVHSSVICLV